MEVSPAAKLARFAYSLLALVVCPDALGDSGEPQGSNTLVIMASDGVDMPTSALGRGSELIIRAGEDEFAMATDGPATTPSSAEEPVAVVANSSPKPALSVIADDEVVPAAAMRRSGNALRSSGSASIFGQGPRRPSAPTAGIQQGASGQRVASRPQASEMPRGGQTPPPSNLQVNRSAKHEPSPAAAAQASKSSPAPAKPTSASDTLVQAYELSLKASTETEYSQIVRWCADGMRLGLKGENRQFCLELSAWALNRRGQIRAEQGQDALALADFRAAIDFDPHCWRALHNRGVTFAQQGQFAEAFDDISRVIELNPQHAKAYSNRATLYVQAGNMERAIADYEAALAIDPQLVPALVGHARVCHMVGRFEQALASFDAAIAQDDSSAEVVCSRADLLVDLGQYGDALRDYARAIDLNPNFEHAYRNGAWLLATCPDDGIRDVEGALSGAQKALECGYGERHSALDTLAAALANAGRFDEAIATVQQAIEVAPEEARAAYQGHLELYEAGAPFRTQAYSPEDEVQTAEFVEVDG